MLTGERVQIKMVLHGEQRLMVGKIKVLSGKLAWVVWDDGRMTKVFASQLEPAQPALERR